MKIFGWARLRQEEGVPAAFSHGCRGAKHRELHWKWRAWDMTHCPYVVLLLQALTVPTTQLLPQRAILKPLIHFPNTCTG